MSGGSREDVGRRKSRKDVGRQKSWKKASRKTKLRRMSVGAARKDVGMRKSRKDVGRRKSQKEVGRRIYWPIVSSATPLPHWSSQMSGGIDSNCDFSELIMRWMRRRWRRRRIKVSLKRLKVREVVLLGLRNLGIKFFPDVKTPTGLMVLWRLRLCQFRLSSNWLKLRYIV